MSDLHIEGSNSGGTIHISGSGWPPNGWVNMRMTDMRMTNWWLPTMHADENGHFSYEFANPCVEPGGIKLAATNGNVQEGAEYNWEWSNIFEWACDGHYAPPEEEAPEEEQPAEDHPSESGYEGYEETETESESESY